MGMSAAIVLGRQTENQCEHDESDRALLLGCQDKHAELRAPTHFA